VQHIVKAHIPSHQAAYPLKHPQLVFGSFEPYL
jgi:hypothetical protein